MLNPKALLIAGAMAATGTAGAMPDCTSDWEYRALLIEEEAPQNGVFELMLTNELTIQLERGKAGYHVDMKTAAGQTIPIRKINQGVVPVRGKNPLITHYGFGPDVLDPALNPGLTVPGKPANSATVEPTPGWRGQVWVDDSARNIAGPNAPIKPAIKACVRWTYWPRTPNTAHYPSSESLINFPSWVVTAFEDCGLPDSLLLSGRMPRPGYRNRAWLEPDLNGDGLYDLVALVDEPSSGRSGLAICNQADRNLEVIGIESENAPDTMSSDFLAGIDWWSIDGRSVLLGMEGAGSQRLLRDDDGHLISKWMGD